MYADRKITCTNEDGYSIAFSERLDTVYTLCSVDGIYDVLVDLKTTANSTTHGSRYSGSRLKERDISITVKDADNYTYDRNLLTRVFAEGENITLTYEDSDEKRYCTCRVEKIKPKAKTSRGGRLTQIDLVATDPFFYAMTESSYEMATWIGNFTFPHVFPSEGEELGYKSLNKSVDIVNETGINDIGLTITITTTGVVTNPTLRHVESNYHIKLGTEDKPLNLIAYDKLVITTGVGNKHVYLVRNGVTSEINQYLTEDSELFQLINGDNNIGYAAEEGEEYMSIVISFRERYANC